MYSCIIFDERSWATIFTFVFTQISIPIGAVECWVFMCCLELVEALKRIHAQKNRDSDGSVIVPDMNGERLQLEYASLWNLARIKVGKITCYRLLKRWLSCLQHPFSFFLLYHT